MMTYVKSIIWYHWWCVVNITGNETFDVSIDDDNSDILMSIIERSGISKWYSLLL